MLNRMRTCLGLSAALLLTVFLSGQSSETSDVRLIVQFAEPPLLRQALVQLPESTRVRLNGRQTREILSSKPAQLYQAELAQSQAERLHRLESAVPGLRAGHRYQYAFNGASVTVKSSQVGDLMRQPGVLAVFPSIRLQPEDEYTEQMTAIPAAWTLMAQEYGAPRPGEGMRIAIIDTGVEISHPSFNDTGFTAPPGFPVSETVVNGFRTRLPAGSVNNKVIVANVYQRPGSSGYSRAVSDVHGSMVAATAAGIPVRLDDPSRTAVMQGAAPFAYLLNLMVEGEAPEFLAALDDAVKYGADVLNISQGTTAWLSWAAGRNPIQEALEALAEAGVVTCLSAGNAGVQGAGTISATFKYSDQVLIVGNQNSERPYATGKLSAVAPSGAAGDSNLQGLELTSSFPFQAAFRAPLVSTALVLDSRGHVDDDYSRKALYPFPPGSLAGKIALAERGAVAGLSTTFATKWTNVKAGGAIALIVYNNYGLNDPSYIPIGPIFTPDPYAVMERTGGLALDEAARKYASTLEIEMARSNIMPQQGNLISPSSSRGPTPQLRIKPDLAVPATNVLLPAFTVSGNIFTPNGFGLSSGTSFASPLAAGAAALLQQAHPDWSSRQVRAALVSTVETQVAPTQAQVNIMAQGAGSARMDRALRPALHISPYALSLGSLISGQRRTATLEVEDTRSSEDTGLLAYRIDAVPVVSGPSIQPEAPQLNLAGGQRGYFRIAFSIGDIAPGDYSGHLVINGPGRTYQSVPYFIRVPAAPAADVLLVLWRDDGFTASHRQRYEAMLAQAGLGFEVLELRRGDPMPTLQRLQRYRVVVLSTGDVSNSFISSLSSGSFPWQGYLLAGGKLLISGHAFNSRVSYPSGFQNQGADFLLSGSGAGFIPVTANPIPAGATRATIRLGGLIGSVDISSGTGGDGADNQKGIDLGRLVSAGDMISLENAAELAPHIRKLLAASEISVDGSPITISASEDAVATGVWPDTTLDRPAASVSWSAAFLSFGLEGVNNGAGHLSGAELLTRLYRWLVDDLTVRLDVTQLVPGKTATLKAVVATTLTGNGGQRFRWDFGDGSPILSGTASEVSHLYPSWPSRPPRVEVTDSVGHTVVSQASLYLPFLSPAEGWSVEMRIFNTGSQPIVPVFLAFNDAGLELARRGDRSILPGGCVTMGMADLFPSISAGLIQHLRIDSAGSLEALAVILSSDGEEMTSLSAQHFGQPQLYVPHISQAVQQYYTRYAVVRTANSRESVQFEGNGGARPIGLDSAANSQQRKTFTELYDGTLPPALEWGRFFSDGGSSILAGAELFGRVDGPRQLAAMPLDGNSGRTLSFVHVSSDSELFWTGMVYTNVGDTPVRITVKSYNAGGQERAGATHTLAPGAKQVLLYDRRVTTTVPSIALDFTADVAWVQVQSDGSLIGYELFGTVDDSRLEGLTAPSAGSRRLLFPYISRQPGVWTGIAVVNLSSSSSTAQLKALDPAGRVLATVNRNYAPFAKDLGLVFQLFDGKLPAGATHLLLESDSPLWGFELFGDDAGRRMGGANAIPLP